MSSKPRITIVGLGRTGASLGLALKKANPDLDLVGHDKEPRTAQAAQKRGAVDRTEWNLLNACDGAGLIILAMPLAGVQQALHALRGELPPGVIVTDTASTKAPVLEWAKQLPNGVNFIGGHPIISPAFDAGRGESDEEADAALFENAVYCLIPALNASENSIRVVSTFVSLLGARPLFLDAQEHDGLITGAEHLPYLLAAALLHATTTSSGWRDLSQLAGRDYREATAAAARDPQQQRALLLHHRRDLIRWIDTLTGTLEEMRSALEREDAAMLDRMLGAMIEARAAWLRGPGRTPALDTSDLKPSLSRMLLGGLVPRERKKK